MELNINKDEAQLINCALTYYLQRGAVYWYKDVYPAALSTQEWIAASELVAIVPWRVCAEADMVILAENLSSKSQKKSVL